VSTAKAITIDRNNSHGCLRIAWRVMGAGEIAPERLLFSRMRWRPTPPFLQFMPGQREDKETTA
jgi:hypothetical protein